MGVTGLWNLIGPCGKPVPVETLENKILAVDISIWLHQVVKGFQDNKGAALNNAHLLGLFHRLCKLLHYRIKPIFIFDGKVPQLKRDTIAKRSANRNKILSEAERIQNLLLQNLANEKIVQTALGASASEILKITTSPQKPQKRKKQEEEDENLFKLPEIPEDPSNSREWETATETEEDETDTSTEDLQAIDVTSKHFKKLPADVRYDILTDIKEARKQSSWGRLHELPSHSDDFSSFQMKRLLKRRQVQVTLEETEQEMGGLNVLSYDQIENMFQQSDNFDFEKLPTKQIASDENVRFLYIKNLKKTLTEVPKDGEEAVKEEVKEEPTSEPVKEEEFGGEFETDLKKAIAMSLEMDKTQVYSKDDYVDDSVKLNRSQKRNFKNATKLARGFMIEYGGMNDEDIDELLEEDEEREQSMMFSFSHDYTQNQPSTSKAFLKEVEEVVEIPETQQEAKSGSEDDFIEIPDSQEDKINIVINPSKDFNEEDDIFADVFGDAPEKTEAEEIKDSEDSDDDFVEIPDSQEMVSTKAPKKTGSEEIKDSEDSDDDFVEIPDSQELASAINKQFEGSSSKGSELGSVEIPDSQELVSTIKDQVENSSTIGSVEIPGSQDLYTEIKKRVGKSNETDSDESNDDDFIEIPDSQETFVEFSEEGQSNKNVHNRPDDLIVIPDSQETVTSKVVEATKTTFEEQIESNSEVDTILEEPLSPGIPLPSLEEALSELNKKSPTTHKTPSKKSKEDDFKSILELEKSTPPAHKTPSKSSKEDILKTLQEEMESVKNMNVSKTSLDDYLKTIKAPKQEEVIEILDEESSKPKPSPKTPSKSNPNSPSIKNYFEVQYKIKRTPDKPLEEENVTPKRKRKTPLSTPSPSPRKSLFPDKSADLQNLADELEQKRKDLEAERNRKGRMGTSISERMQKECMQLLSLFGIPYIVAPTEAEAQCAYLNMKKFTHGTITDDSDIWLFGGQTVYKNFFMQHKNVMEFKIENIQNTFNVNRGKLIQLAMLVGSDYSTGINGIGAVTALEILATFAINERNMRPSDSSKSTDDLILCSLERFREWLKGTGPSASSSRNTLKKKLKNIEIQDGFPNKCIVEAYLHPTVEQPSDKLEWGTPNLEAIEEFAKKFLGWTAKKTNETILPVLKRFNDKRVQANIRNYFDTQKVVQNKQTQMSKRVKKAVDRLATDGKDSEEEVEKPKKRRTKKDPVEGEKKPRAPRKKAEGGEGKPKAIRKRKSSEGGETEKSKVSQRRKTKDGEHESSNDQRKIPLIEEDIIPQKKKHEEEILQNREKAAEVLRNLKGRK